MFKQPTKVHSGMENASNFVYVKSALRLIFGFYISPKANVTQLKWLEDGKLDTTITTNGYFFFPLLLL